MVAKRYSNSELCLDSDIERIPLIDLCEPTAHAAGLAAAAGCGLNAKAFHSGVES